MADMHATFTESDFLHAKFEEVIQIQPTGTKEVTYTANGEYSEDIAAYGDIGVTVDVPNTYTAEDEGKVVDGGALVEQGSLAVSANGTYDTTTVESVEVDVIPPDWERPKEWPNLDLLHEDDYALYVTYDNTSPPTKFSVTARGPFKVERVQLNDDGTTTALETWTSLNSGDGTIVFFISEEAGDYPLFRLSGLVAGKPDMFGFATNGQRVLERWWNLLTCFTIRDYAYSNWNLPCVQADTFVNIRPEGMNAVNFSDMKSLRTIRVLDASGTGSKLRVGKFGGNANLRSFDSTNTSPSNNNYGSRFRYCYSLKRADLSNWSMTGVADLSYMFNDCQSLEELIMPSGDWSSITNIYQIFTGCFVLRTPIIFPRTFRGEIGGMAFHSCYNLRAVILLPESALVLNNVNAFTNIVRSEQTVKVYVRQSLIEDYKAATNWSALYATNNSFLQPIEGSELEYLLEGE